MRHVGGRDKVGPHQTQAQVQGRNIWKHAIHILYHERDVPLDARMSTLFEVPAQVTSLARSAIAARNEATPSHARLIVWWWYWRTLQGLLSDSKNTF